MGKCSCGTVFLSPEEAALLLGVTYGRIRAILSRHPWRLGAIRIGRGWVLPAEAVAAFNPQPSGVHLTNQDVKLPKVAICPSCRQRLYTTDEVAAELSLSRTRVCAILSRRPQRLLAFRVGHRWVIPEAGLQSYKERRGQVAQAQARLLQLVAGAEARYWTTHELAAEARRQGRPISLRRIQRMCQEGKIPVDRPGRDYMVPDAAAKMFLRRWVGGGEEKDEP